MAQETISQEAGRAPRHRLPSRGVVVGIDDSASGLRAVVWAARDAHARRLPLVVCRAFPLSGGPPVLDGPDPARDAARSLARAGVEAARLAVPDVEAHPWTGPGTAESVLFDAIEEPEMIVVGSRGRGTLGALLLGSTGIDAARRSTRPVVVVHGPRDEPPGHPDLLPPYAGHVVVGVDGTDRSAAALRFAFAEAELRGCPLVAVHVRVLMPAETWWDETLLELHEEVRSPDWTLLQTAVEPHRYEHPAVPVKLARHNAPAAEGLLRAARDAELLVVGTSGYGRIGGIIGGSVSRAVLIRASCPVAVVPSSVDGAIDR